ncbi:MAG: hypothetical protein HYR85_01605 [Planctomycetes bacterium]|nr:hypothetical protein [Planctomycetota bacterium]MBI3845962.1 hypothetical protein [Planctomycetota bacterium]
MARRLIVWCVLLNLIGAVAWATGAPDGDKKITVNEQMVLLGNAQKFTKAATVNTAEVFKNIPSYKQIKTDGLTEKDAKYWILLEQANKDFNKALGEVAKAGSHDLVTEAGGITANGVDVADLTEAVNKKFKP